MKWGDEEEYLLELVADGTDVAAFDSKPDLTPLQLIAFEAYWLLSPGRQMGMGPGGISTVDILAMAEHTGLPADWFLRVVRWCDRAYLEAVAKTIENNGHRTRGSST